jgi:hypothetical protein
MLSTLLAIGWEPEIRGYIVVLIMVGTLIGGTYLILGTNLGARLGFLVAACGLAGWMMSMAIIWVIYGIGLQGPFPSWKPSEPVALVRDAAQLDLTEIVEVSPEVKDKTRVDSAAAVQKQLEAEGWTRLDDSDPQRGQAVASADEIIQIEAEEFKSGEYVPVAVYDRSSATPSTSSRSSTSRAMQSSRWRPCCPSARSRAARPPAPSSMTASRTGTW